MPRPIVLLAALIPAICLIGGCSTGGGTSPSVPVGSSAPVASIVVALPQTSIAVSGTVQVTATAKDASGNVVSGAALTWSSGNPTVASINSTTGSVTGLLPGSAQITASANGITSPSVSLSVTPGFLQISPMVNARSRTTITMLDNGLALIAGGVNSGGMLNTAELYNPANQTFTLTGSLNTIRYSHTATVLNDGTVLIAGGWNAGGVVGSAELYDPVAGTFTPTGSLITARLYHTATHLQNGMVLLAGGSNGVGTIWNSAELYDPTLHAFTPTGSMSVARRYATATPLNDGTVLVAGGLDATGNALASAEIFDPETGSFTLVGSMGNARAVHTATLLNGGAVLMTGGTTSDAAGAMPIASAELYDPTTRSFSPAGRLNTARADASATLLNNGTVLISGGRIPASQSPTVLTSAEIYDPISGTFTPTGNLCVPHGTQAAVLLPNGFVLFAGNFDLPAKKTPAELYEPATFTPVGLQSIAVTPGSPNISPGAYQSYVAMGTFANGTQQLASVTWSSSGTSTAEISTDASNPGASVAVGSPSSASTVTISATAGTVSGSSVLNVRTAGFVNSGPMHTPRAVFWETRLYNGYVLVADGEGTLPAAPTAELYNPATGSFSPTGTPIAERDLFFTATLMKNGKVLIAGGFTQGFALGTAEVYDPKTELFKTTGPLNIARYAHTATVLRSGKVLIAGGFSSPSTPVGPAELYDPETGTFSEISNLNIARGLATATELDDGTVLIAGGQVPSSGSNSSSFPASAELYDPNLNAFSIVGSLNAPRFLHTATLLQSGMVLIAGGNNTTGDVASAEIYDPSSRSFLTAGSLNQPRLYNTATLLNSGKVLIAGGDVISANGQAISELYDPVTKEFTPASALVTSREAHAAVLLDCGMVLVSGGASTLNSTFPMTSSETY